MLRTRTPAANRLSRDAQRLIALADAYAHSGSRLEDSYWERQLADQLDRVLLGRRNQTVELALDQLYGQQPEAYDILIEQAEARAESTSVTHEDQPHDALLFAVPLAVWTRYQLPQVQLSARQQETVAGLLGQHLIAEGARFSFLPQFLSFDHLPRSFQEMRQWTQRLAKIAVGAGGTPPRPLEAPEESDTLLADARFLVGVVAAPAGSPLFRWQMQAGDGLVSRESCHQAWVEACQPVLSPLFTGCHVDFLPADAYYTSSREADRRIRPLAIQAAVAWLQGAAQLAPSELRATIAACGEQVAEEYRVGFCTRQGSEVIYGCIWPILSKEEAVPEGMDSGQVDVPDEIAALLRTLGLEEIRRLPGLHPPEYCDDCGAPFFPNPLGEMQHPELPEDADTAPQHFH